MQAQSAVTSREEQTSFHVSGRVFGIDDEASKPYPLPNAHVRLVCLNDTDVATVAVTDSEPPILDWRQNLRLQ